MAVIISSVDPRSPAGRAGIKAGERLLSLNGHTVRDVLDYQFYSTEQEVELVTCLPGESPRTTRIKKGEYTDLGLGFESYLMDEQQRCRNRCIFCFIDQNPPGLRESLYFKDDDERLSFLFGNYITLTNLTEREVRRIIEMRIAPMNISVHTMDPKLRAAMMGNKNAGAVLSYMKRFYEAGIPMNVQLVLVPGINDGEALRFSLEALRDYRPVLASVACVPVGLTAHREGLPSLRPFTKAEAAAVIELTHSILDHEGQRFAYPSDEFFLLAGYPMPDCDYYGDFAQLENGVGMSALFKDEFVRTLEDTEPGSKPPRLTLLTGEAAAPLLTELVARAKAVLPDLEAEVIAVKNHFFGGHVSVAGLVTGRDILSATKGRNLGDRVVFPDAMLRREGDLFLDDMRPEELELACGRPFICCPTEGGALAELLLGRLSTN